MSVIPLILEGEHRTVVDRGVDFKGIEGKVILIQGLDRTQLQSEGDANVSYDLRVGREYRDHRNLDKNELSDEGSITLLPGAAVIVQTEELVHFPRTAFGQIVPKVSLLQKGLSNTSSKVDPGYNGNLLVTMFNLGKRTVQLQQGERFCSIYVLQVGDGARPYDKPPKRIEGSKKRRPWQSARDLLEMNVASIMAILLIFTIVQIVVAFR